MEFQIFQNIIREVIGYHVNLIRSLTNHAYHIEFGISLFQDENHASLVKNSEQCRIFKQVKIYQSITNLVNETLYNAIRNNYDDPKTLNEELISRAQVARIPLENYIGTPTYTFKMNEGNMIALFTLGDATLPYLDPFIPGNATYLGRKLAKLAPNQHTAGTIHVLKAQSSNTHKQRPPKQQQAAQRDWFEINRAKTERPNWTGTTWKQDDQGWYGEVTDRNNNTILIRNKHLTQFRNKFHTNTTAAIAGQKRCLHYARIVQRQM
jgi:hypothetical protein